jgi:hypothetical protein
VGKSKATRGTQIIENMRKSMEPDLQRGQAELEIMNQWALQSLEDIRVFKQAELRRLTSTMPPGPPAA